jgi:hypothetical protein
VFETGESVEKIRYLLPIRSERNTNARIIAYRFQKFALSLYNGSLQKLFNHLTFLIL